MEWTIDLNISLKFQETVKLLISAGADLSIHDRRGDTPIHHFMRLWGKYHFRHKAMVELLIQNGADLNMRDSFGNTPLKDCPICQEKYVNWANKHHFDVNWWQQSISSAADKKAEPFYNKIYKFISFYHESIDRFTVSPIDPEKWWTYLSQLPEKILKI